jgi:GNAT superfamily N-acetyltransferase
MAQIEITDDPVAFLDAAGGYLAADPVLSTVVGSVTRRAVREDAAGRAPAAHPRWWAVARDDRGEVVGAAMRTAPFEPHPPYVLPMPEDAAVALARLMVERGEAPGGVNGALPAARLVADEVARLTGGAVEVHEHLRLFELGDLRLPASPPGRLREATVADAELVLDWFRGFGAAAAEQAGRTGAHQGPAETFTLDDIVARIEDRVVWLWQDGGEPVHLTAANLPADGVSRVGPVYTPAAARGRGYASRAVAEVSALLRASGSRCCLFTDQANPTSNKIYEAIGYRPVTDMVTLLVG